MTELRTELQDALGAAYTIERELGGGGMSRVFLAEETRFHRRVVIKVLSPELAAGLSADRFEREIALAAGLQQANIVPVITAGDVGGLPWYSMPYVDGESLRTRLTGAPVAPAESVAILRDVARALAYAHERGIIHRDIKPENVLLSGGAAVVTDFGIAKAVVASRTKAPGGTLTVVGTSLGTPAYMAPEQAAGDDVDARADVYAWGVMAYEMLAGRHPFAGKHSAQQLMAAHIAELPASLAKSGVHVPPRLAHAVMRTLAKDPAQRPQSASELIEVLNAVPTTGASTLATGGARMSWGIIGGAVAAVLLVLGVLVMSRLHGNTPAPSRDETSAVTGPRSPTSAAITTVAVLPFTNTGGDANDDYLGVGMTDELAHALARLPAVQVAGRTSSYSFKGRNVTAQEIGRALHVGGVVEGTVRRAGARLRITAQLTGASDNLVRWSDVFETSITNVFQVQDDMTRAIVVALAPALGGSAPAVASRGRGTSDVVAYDLYLKGRYFWAKRGTANVLRAVEYFTQAIARDASFARAHAALAQAYDVMPNDPALNADSLFALGEQSAKRALALDPILADAHLALGSSYMNRMRFAEAEKELRMGLELDPGSATGHQWNCLNDIMRGRPEPGLIACRHAEALDPLSPVIIINEALALGYLRRPAEALAAWKRARELDPSLVGQPESIASAFLQAGQADSAIALLEPEARNGTGASPQAFVLMLAYDAVGRSVDAERLRARIVAAGARSKNADRIVVALRDGNTAAALDLIEHQLGHDIDLWDTACTPFFDALRTEPRFLTFLARVGMEPCRASGPPLIKVRRR